MFLCGVGSRNAMVGDSSRVGFHATLCGLAGVESDAAPHPDTPYTFLQVLNPSHLIGLQRKMTRRLFRMRCFDQFRFGNEWLVAVDATWLRTYDRKHCERCLTQKQADGSIRYMHAVLEAKLILANGMAISLGSVPIENADSKKKRGKDKWKQDCELKAFPRLAQKLKKAFPRLPICLVMDSLYACKPVMELCAEMNWSYIAVLKETRTSKLWEKAVTKAARQDAFIQTQEDGTVQTFRWATNLEHGGQTTHAVFCDEVDTDSEEHHWAWITDHRPDQRTTPIIANQGGRRRWKIENEGFNEQKNGEIELKHDYGSKKNAWYNDYLVVQVVHTLIQLMQFGDLVKKLSNGIHDSFSAAFKTLRAFVVQLRESVQRDRLAPALAAHPPERIRVRFDTS